MMIRSDGPKHEQYVHATLRTYIYTRTLAYPFIAWPNRQRIYPLSTSPLLSFGGQDPFIGARRMD